jgi:rubrerythrin
MTEEFVCETNIGVSKGTSVEEQVKMNFRGETSEVGLYLAMSKQALREGFPEIAMVFEKLAKDEAWHAARFAELNGMIAEDTKKNIEKMLAGEKGANKGKRQAAEKAKEAECEEAGEFFYESSRDEARHARALQGLLKRYF